jgi:SAM-dependent methyltransferase
MFKLADVPGSRMMKVRCWCCGSMLDLSPRDTVPACSSCGHMYEERDGIFDFLPPGSRSSVSDPFESSYGEFYDAAMTQRRWIVDLGRLVWDSDMNVMLDSMAAGASSDPDETVLDVPVGGGTSLALGADIGGLLVGVDRSLPMLRRASRRRRTARLESKTLLLRGDACALPLSNGSVDRALCFNGLHIIKDRSTVLREISRVLKPGGHLVGSTLVTDTTLMSAWSLMAMTLAGIVNPPSSGELVEQGLSAGFASWEQERSGAILHFRATAA